MNASKEMPVYKAIEDVTGVTPVEFKYLTTDRKIHYLESTISSLITRTKKNNSRKNKLRSLQNTINYLIEEKARLLLSLNP